MILTWFWGHFELFGALVGPFWGQGRVRKLFWGLLIQTKNFCFQSMALFLLYHVVLSSCWCWWWFPVIILSQPNYSYGCFVVLTMVVVGLWQLAETGCTTILFRKNERKTDLSYSKLIILNGNLWIYVGDINFRPQMISKVALPLVLKSG